MGDSTYDRTSQSSYPHPNDTSSAANSDHVNTYTWLPVAIFRFGLLDHQRFRRPTSMQMYHRVRHVRGRGMAGSISNAGCKASPDRLSVSRFSKVQVKCVKFQLYSRLARRHLQQNITSCGKLAMRKLRTSPREKYSTCKNGFRLTPLEDQQFLVRKRCCASCFTVPMIRMEHREQGWVVNLLT